MICMKYLFQIAGVALLMGAATACSSHYRLTDIRQERIVIDSRYDGHPHQRSLDVLSPYRQKVDSVMSPVVGTIAHDMAADRPESNLSNLLADILVWAGKSYGEKPVLGVYNMGGIRADLTKGPVTYGDILAVAPFENKIAFVTLSGKSLMELFEQIAARGGEGVSHGTELVISADGKLLSARLNGREIDTAGRYRVVTIDYLVQGNDGLGAFLQGADLNSPQEAKNNSRFIIMDYFKEQAARRQAVSAKVEGRISVKK